MLKFTFVPVYLTYRQLSRRYPGQDTFSYNIQIEQIKVIIESQDILDYSIRNKFTDILGNFNNYTIIVSKLSKQSIGWPYGKCVHYSTNGQPFGATSQTHCYRKCLKELYRTRFKCVPLFIDNMLHESDINYLMTTRTKICETSPQMLKNLRNINSNICHIKCPEDCHKVYYSSVLKKTIEYFGNQVWFDKMKKLEHSVHRRVVWDRSQPMLTYIEEPVLTFSQFVVNCGGLLGLCFGKSAKDLIIWILELKTSNRITNTIRTIKTFID